jgi:hypothetical protein
MLLHQSHRKLLAIACAKNLSLSEAMDMVIESWRKKYAYELGQWKCKTDPDFQLKRIPFSLPQWHIDDPKTRTHLILRLDLARDLYPGMVMHGLKKSWFMNALIWIWYNENRKEVKEFTGAKPEDLKKIVPRLYLGRKTRIVTVELDEDDQALTLPSHLRSE